MLLEKSILFLAAATGISYFHFSEAVTACGTLLFLAIVLRIQILLFKPLEYRRTEADFKAGSTKRKVGDVPPPYPNGWWSLMVSTQLKPGQVKSVDFMGISLVAFRTMEGTVGVLDAYCPHLGANLGIGSKVVGTELECAFHGWRFNTEGKCTQIPGQNQIPEMATVRKWKLVERNDLILVWHHVDNIEPTWEVPEFAFDYTIHGDTEHIVIAHCQEIPENGPDVAHLNYLHKSWVGTNLVPLIHHIWEASWVPGTEEDKDRHLAYVSVKQQTATFGRPIPFLTMNVNILQVGPGIVQLNFPLPLGFGLKVTETVTPVAPLKQRVCHTVHGSPWTPRFVAKLFLRLFMRIVEQDMAVWNNKTYLPKPTLSRPDKAVPVFRRWYQQFYTEKSYQAASLLKPLEW